MFERLGQYRDSANRFIQAKSEMAQLTPKAYVSKGVAAGAIVLGGLPIANCYLHQPPVELMNVYGRSIYDTYLFGASILVMELFGLNTLRNLAKGKNPCSRRK
ncbi:MAG: hypothetical protein JW727_06195 [Candidatus Aenigmarchaeota archaeon]|nr:hypothetical protein [Candidatus Aenigmarchaeota archaeon]